MTKLAALVFDRMTNLDFVGPHEVFARLPDIEIIICSPDGKPVRTDFGMCVDADTPLSAVGDVDILFVAGGPGVGELLKQADLLEEMERIGSGAGWVTSVCTGALALGAAGLLEGYRATTHWAALDILPEFGAVPTRERVVVDRNRITGGGVTAGIDFGLRLAAALHGDELAKAIQLGLEYSPDLPFDAGTPESAPPAFVERFRGRIAKLTAERLALSRQAWAARKLRTSSG